MNTRKPGPQSEFAEFCDAHHARLVGLLGLFCGNRDLAEELAQETLMRAYRDWPKVRAVDAPVAWLYRVGVNLAKSHFRRRKAEARARERLKGLPVTAHSESPLVVEVRESVRALPPRMRSALVLRYYGDLRVADIAIALDCSETTVKKLLGGALTRLRAEERAVDGKETADAS